MLKLSRAALVHRRNVLLVDVNRLPDCYWVLILLIADPNLENTDNPSKQTKNDCDHNASQGWHRDISRWFRS